MDWVSRGVLHGLKQNPEMLLDIMIALGEELKNQPKKKKERFFAILEEGIRKRVGQVERKNQLLQKEVSRLGKELEELKRLNHAL